MATVASRKSAMTLYASPVCVYSHRARVVLREKNIVGEVELTSHPDELPHDLLQMLPDPCLPVLMDRDLVLYETRIIMEYLDERFPHPPLYPMDPVSRAQARMLIHRIEHDWYALLTEIQSVGEKKSARTRKQLKESLVGMSPVFSARPYFMGDEFSLVDCCMGPLLWRLPASGVDIPKQATGLRQYALRLFQRDGFRLSLSEYEQDIGNLAAFGMDD
ncbi:MAG: hypothetical protein RIQ52_741 [Pseudomonadota bacterium]